MLNSDLRASETQRAFNDFVLRLQTINIKRLPKKLLDSVSPSMVKQTITLLLEEPYVQAIRALEPNQAIRFKKNEVWARTCSVLRDPAGEFRCILETKSKDPHNRKRAEADQFSGNSKRGKKAWRLEDPCGRPMPYISLVSVNNGQAEEKPRAEIFREIAQPFQKEVDFTWSLPALPCINRPVLGAFYYNKNGWQQSYYAPLGLSLADAIQAKTLSFEDKEQITTQLFLAVQTLHTLRYQHQDIKPDNIVLFFDDSNKVERACLIDFEAVAGPGYENEVGLTSGYESPEIAQVCLRDPTFIGEGFMEYYTQQCDSIGKILAQDILAKADHLHNTDTLASYKVPHPANDVFALGVTLRSLWEDSPQKGKANNIIAQMLQADRSQRASISELKTAWRHLRNADPAKPQKRKTPSPNTTMSDVADKENQEPRAMSRYRFSN